MNIIYNTSCVIFLKPIVFWGSTFKFVKCSLILTFMKNDSIFVQHYSRRKVKDADVANRRIIKRTDKQALNYKNIVGIQTTDIQ